MLLAAVSSQRINTLLWLIACLIRNEAHMQLTLTSGTFQETVSIAFVSLSDPRIAFVSNW